MSKMFSLQSPENIAKEYGGNKQKIAQAMQMGVVDPTAGTLAGMFIDRMRGAQMQEGAQQPSVAQQVFAPPAPPAPMGAPPMGGMPPDAPPMGAPPMGGMPPGAPPMGAPPMGMADGGLAALPISESMFDEPMDGEYAGGGIVSFNPGGLASMLMGETEDEEQEVLARRDPEQLYGFFRDPRKGMEQFQQLYKPERKYTDKANAFFEEVLSPEGQKKRRDEDKYFALAQLGATMASTPGSLLQAASAGINAAIPGLRSASKELRAETRDAIKQLALSEGESNKQALESAKMGIEGQGKYADAAEAAAKRIADENLAFIREKGDTARAVMQIAGQKDVAGIYARAQEGSNPLKLAADIQGKIQAEAQDAVNKAMENELPAFTPEQKAAQDARRQQLFNMEVGKRSQAYAAANPLFAQMLGIAPGGSTSAAAGGLREGMRSKDRNGRDIVVMNGQWVYP